MKRLLPVLGFTALFAGFYLSRVPLLHAADQAIHGPYSVEERLKQYGEVVESRLTLDLARAGVAYPPARMTLVILKQERQVQLYAANLDGTERFIRSYPILAASGHAGPKLHEGDEQVPEGVYEVESLNPNSSYHLALHVNYPNAEDRQRAREEGRTQLGGDIMIHGSDVSIGCVAMGDAAAEDLFILTARVGRKNVRLLFCPVDFRVTPSTTLAQGPDRTRTLYAELESNLKTLPLPVADSR